MVLEDSANPTTPMVPQRRRRWCLPLFAWSFVLFLWLSKRWDASIVVSIGVMHCSVTLLWTGGAWPREGQAHIHPDREVHRLHFHLGIHCAVFHRQLGRMGVVDQRYCLKISTTQVKRLYSVWFWIRSELLLYLDHVLKWGPYMAISNQPWLIYTNNPSWNYDTQSQVLAISLHFRLVCFLASTCSWHRHCHGV